MPTPWNACGSPEPVPSGRRFFGPAEPPAIYDKLIRLNQPTPAIVAQDAVRRLPRIALLLFCVAYVVPGFVGREPWKNADITAFGYMFELARGTSSWFAPTFLGQPPEFDALLPYWLGAWAMHVSPAWIAPDFAARLPFIALLVLTLLATWYGVYSLAREPQAQPVPFAFGGEANPTDYARAMADGGLLALIACLGLAQLSHETTPALAQVAFTSVTFYAIAALPRRPVVATLWLLAGMTGLALSGAPSMAILFGAGGLVISLFDADGRSDAKRTPPAVAAAILGIAVGVTAALAAGLGLWRWRIDLGAIAHESRGLGRLLIWFTWPAWPLALWTLWRWRRQLGSRHVALPLWFVLVSVVTTWVTASSDRSLLLGLPAFATLAAFALPTLRRSVAALVDWFTLLFFSGCAVIIWVIWISMQTGVPAKPAANVHKLAPGFEPSFSLVAFLLALAATVAWAWLVRWRTGRHRLVIWKSLVLPAGGAALCWLLLMTLWLPVLDFARSYAPMVRAVTRQMDRPGCVEALGLSRAQGAAFRYHGGIDLRPAVRQGACPWLLVSAQVQPAMALAVEPKDWQLVSSIRRAVNPDDNVLLFRKAPGR
jgi:4-amino-4-deoxy-L-arabinose transferase-like glycosyltransferase